MRKNTPIFKWLGLALFVIGFIHNKDFYQFPFIQVPYDFWMMVGGAIIAFLLGNPLRWLGGAIFVFGFALSANWISLTLPNNVVLDPVWVMFGGYATLFLNSKY